MKLDVETVRWIEVALQHIRYGEILITVHDHKVTGVDTKNRERIRKPYSSPGCSYERTDHRGRSSRG